MLSQACRRIVSEQLSLTFVFRPIPRDEHNAEIWFWNKHSNIDTLLAFEYSSNDSTVTTNLELFDKLNLCQTKEWICSGENLKLFLYNDLIDDDLKVIDFQIKDDEKYDLNEDDECWSIIKCKKLVQLFHIHFRHYMHANFTVYSQILCDALCKFMNDNNMEYPLNYLSLAIGEYFECCLDEENQQEIDSLLKFFLPLSEFKSRKLKSKELLRR